MYECSQCGRPLFSSLGKFAHSSPWPAFDRPVDEKAIAKRQEVGTKGAFKVRYLLLLLYIVLRMMTAATATDSDSVFLCT